MQLKNGDKDGDRKVQIHMEGREEIQKDGKKQKTNRKNIFSYSQPPLQLPDFRFGARFKKVERNKLAVKIHIMKSLFLRKKKLVKNSFLKY